MSKPRERIFITQLPDGLMLVGVNSARGTVRLFEEVTDEKPGDVVEMSEVYELLAEIFRVKGYSQKSVMEKAFALDKALAAIRKGKAE